MKIKFNIQKVKDAITKYRKIIIIVLCVILLSIILMISFYAYKMYIKSLSPETRVVKIQSALTPISYEDLTSFIDFRQLTLGMANSILKDPRNKFPDDMNAITLSESIQKTLLSLLKKKIDDKEPPEVSIFDPYVTIPDDIYKQLVSKLKVIKSNEDKAVIEFTIDYLRTNTKIAVKLQMENTESYGWRVTKILNAEEIIEHHYMAKQKVRDLVVNFINEKNNVTLKELERYFTIKSCSAYISTLADKTTEILTITINGHNNGPYIIFNFNMHTSYYNSKTKKKITDFSLNLARRSFPNEKFDNTWNIEIDPENAKHKMLLNNLPMTCTAQFNNMTLSSGKILYMKEIPEEK